MSREEAIKVINNHLEHWKRLVRGKICDETEGAETISAFELAISALTLKSPCSLCRFRNEDTGICDMCPAMPLERESEDKE